MRHLSFLALLLLALPSMKAQIYKLQELNTTQVAALDRAHTVIIIPDGLMEEHGPFLPSYTDGYVDEALTQDLARSIVERPGWVAAIFPVVPLGTSPANVIAQRYSFPGSFTVSQRTVRNIYMDLADSFGEMGFRYVFIVDSHGGPTQSVALDAASDYFRDTYHGTMVHLLGTMLIFDCCHPMEETLPKEQVAANGMEVHAGTLEQSLLLFLQPALVPVAYRSAGINGAADFPGLMASASKSDWPGYLGAPKFATAALGALAYRELAMATEKLTAEILDGTTDPYALPRYGATFLKLTDDLEQPLLRHEDLQQKRQDGWIKAHPAAIATARTKP